MVLLCVNISLVRAVYTGCDFVCFSVVGSNHPPYNTLSALLFTGYLFVSIFVILLITSGLFTCAFRSCCRV